MLFVLVISFLKYIINIMHYGKIEGTEKNNFQMLYFLGNKAANTRSTYYISQNLYYIVHGNSASFSFLNKK
jgi:hypothetical protein